MDDSTDMNDKRRSPPLLSFSRWASSWSEIRRVVNDIFEDIPLRRLFDRKFTGFYLVFAIWLIWQLFSLTNLFTHNEKTPSRGEATLQGYFSNFEGYPECGLRAVDLYRPPPLDARGFYEYGTFCRSRKHLLKALSEGGRIGFNAPYEARGRISRPWNEMSSR